MDFQHFQATHFATRWRFVTEEDVSDISINCEINQEILYFHSDSLTSLALLDFWD